MSHKSKVILYSVIGAIGMIIIFLSVKYISDGRFRNRLPEIPESQSLTNQVVEQIAEAETRAKRNPSVDNLGMLGMVYHSNAFYEQATECYKLAIERDDSQWIWYYYLGYLKTEMSESRSVLENYLRVIDINPDAHLARYYIGEEYMNLGEMEQAEKQFSVISGIQKPKSNGNQSIRQDHFPLGTYARFQLSKIYTNTGRNELAEKTLQEIILTNRTYGPAYRDLGNLYRIRGDIPLSNKYGATANDLGDFSPPVDTLIDKLAMLSRSESYLLKKIDEAINSIYSEWALKLIDSGLQYLPESKYLTSKAIKTCLWLNLDDQAVTYVDQHILNSGDDLPELYTMAEFFFEEGLYPYSMKYCFKVLEIIPADYEIEKKLAICYFHMGKPEKTFDLLEKILDRNPENLDLLADVADILIFDLGESERAEDYLTLLSIYSLSNPKVQKMLAFKAEKNGDIQTAIYLYESSFRGNPLDMTVIKNLGTLLTGQKMWDKSIKHYREALGYNNNDPYIMERLGTLLILCPDPGLKNIPEGMVYAERSFIHYSASDLTRISAGRTLALASAMVGDKQKANGIINETMNIARRAGYSEAHLAELQNYKTMFQNMSDSTAVVTN